MKKLTVIILLLSSWGSRAQPGWNLTLLSHYHDPSLPKIGAQVWNANKGWADTLNKREYIIAGSVDSIYFFDITDPNVMKKCDVEGGISHAVNRDFDIYSHYVYCVSDNGTPGALQIFDMQYLPDSVHKVYESEVTGINTHTVFVNPQSKRLYKCINRYRSVNIVTPMEVYSLDSPANPVFLGRLERSFYADVHETYIRNDTAYCSSGNAGLYIYDFKDPLHPKTLGSITPPYPENAYNHSCWLDSSGRYILFEDETADGTGMKVYDISDLVNPKLVGIPFRSFGAPHNAYWKGRFAYASMYYGGVNIYDMDTLSKPKLAAYYRTFDKAHTPGTYEGCWGVYPFLPSGNIIASDMNTGIFLLKPGNRLGVAEHPVSVLAFSCYPNPFVKEASLHLVSSEKQAAHLLVYDLQGKIAVERTTDLIAGEQDIPLDGLENSPSGVYVVKLVAGEGVFHQSIIKQ